MLPSRKVQEVICLCQEYRISVTIRPHASPNFIKINFRFFSELVSCKEFWASDEVAHTWENSSCTILNGCTFELCSVQSAFRPCSVAEFHGIGIQFWTHGTSRNSNLNPFCSENSVCSVFRGTMRNTEHNPRQITEQHGTRNTPKSKSRNNAEHGT